VTKGEGSHEGLERRTLRRCSRGERSGGLGRSSGGIPARRWKSGGRENSGEIGWVRNEKSSRDWSQMGRPGRSEERKTVATSKVTTTSDMSK